MVVCPLPSRWCAPSLQVLQRSSRCCAPSLQVLQRSDFFVMVSFRKAAEWWSYGLVKIQPVASIQGFHTTGKEGMTGYVYINVEKIPQPNA